MPSKGLRKELLSTGTKLDANDNAQKTIKHLLGIGGVSSWLFLYHCSFFMKSQYPEFINTFSMSVLSSL
jgi:hypothetical protein